MDTLEELLQFVENDVTRWEEAADNCEEIARPLTESYQALCHLVACTYRERAQAHRDIVMSIRQRVNESSAHM